MKIPRAKATIASFVFLLSVTAAWAATAEESATIHGYVLDSACAFTKGIKKPMSEECAVSCAKAGSPLVILSDSGAIYWPISDTMPATGQNGRLMEFAGKKVSVTGKVFARGGSRAVVIKEIKAATGAK
jgi:type 1 fimbria pilin